MTFQIASWRVKREKSCWTIRDYILLLYFDISSSSFVSHSSTFFVFFFPQLYTLSLSFLISHGTTRMTREKCTGITGNLLFIANYTFRFNFRFKIFTWYFFRVNFCVIFSSHHYVLVIFRIIFHVILSCNCCMSVFFLLFTSKKLSCEKVETGRRVLED